MKALGAQPAYWSLQAETAVKSHLARRLTRAVSAPRPLPTHLSWGTPSTPAAGAKGLRSALAVACSRASIILKEELCLEKRLVDDE